MGLKKILLHTSAICFFNSSTVLDGWHRIVLQQFMTASWSKSTKWTLTVVPVEN